VGSLNGGARCRHLGNLMTTDPTGEPTTPRRRKPHSPATRDKIRMSLLGVKHTDERRKNISDALAGRSLSEEHRAACSRAQTGRVVTAETRAKISEANTGRVYGPPSAEYRAHLRRVMRNRVFTEKHRENLSTNWNRTQLTCPHCGLASYPPQYGRWHGDRCRRNQVRSRRERPLPMHG
jgi:Straboviridae homing endonuclease